MTWLNGLTRAHVFEFHLDIHVDQSWWKPNGHVTLINWSKHEESGTFVEIQPHQAYINQI